MADVAFIGIHYMVLLVAPVVLTACLDIPNGVAKTNTNGSWTLAANYSQFIIAHPGENYEMEIILLTVTHGT
jgi:hypothetical protein